ncbi:MAG TPA: TonB-dependent receptor [Fodinibius sp.]|nr:TonB-dependent receptor [Fodinibius sp.]
MDHKKIFILLVLLFLTTLSSFAQQKQVITGRILDQQTGEPLIGANIFVPNTSKGTVTDRTGHFKIALSGNVRQLQVSYIGYVRKTITLSDKNKALNILLEPDNVALNEVQVVGFDTNKKLQETAASVALLTEQDFERTSEVSLQPVLNTIPGVQMDQSNLSDARISIRGAGIRSGYGIRNIKIYVNNIPLTEANGFTRIEGLDVSAVGRAEVIKGPASSIYGAGTGGVINFQLEKAPYGTSSIEASGLAGSYGLGRLATTYCTGTDHFNAAITVGRQTYDGYRNHNKDDRTYFTGSLQFFPSQKQTLTLLLNRSRQETYIPGSLNAEQVAVNPRQASAGNVKSGAGRFQTWTRIGAGHSYKFSDQLENTTSLYTSFYDLDHPLSFAYLQQPYQSFGGRTSFVLDPGFSILPTTFTVGGEYLSGRTDAQRFVNNEGEEGALILNQEQNNTQYSVFYQSETTLGSQTTLTLGLSLNKVRYEVTDFMNDSLSGVKDFDVELAPRIALVHVFNDKFALRAGVSSGFSPPTSGEAKNADGHINRKIQAERGVNYEVGARGTLLANRFNYDLTLFSFQMEDQLVPQTVDQGNTIYLNAGETSRRGLEVALSYFWSNEVAAFVHSIRPFVSYSYSDFTFEKFRIIGAEGRVQSDYSGNDVTGIAPHILSAGIDIETAPGFYLNATYFFKDKTPITDENDVYNQAYSLVDTRVGYKATINNYLRIDINAGINNLLDTSYSSLVSLNAASYGGAPPAYYNPAPGRNFYSGLSIRYLF